MSPTREVIRLGLLARALSALEVWTVRLVRETAAARKRRRRLEVSRIGRMSDGMLTDASADTLYFSYCLMGVEYTASQEVGALRDLLPEDHNSLIGAVTLKYSPRNPANSIVLCEEWSGLRTRHQTRVLTTEEDNTPPTLMSTAGSHQNESFGNSTS